LIVANLFASSTFWLAFGFLGQALFTARFLVQWAVSEKKRDSVVPVAFWWLSLLGGSALLSYAIHRRDPVIILGQGMGLFVYVRNLMLVAKGRRREAKRLRREAAAIAASGGSGSGFASSSPSNSSSSVSAPSLGSEAGSDGYTLASTTPSAILRTSAGSRRHRVDVAESPLVERPA
jgi:lipid-A-disaccharide synthase-like uncharacterized protein